MTNQLPFISPTHLNLSTEGLAKLVVGTVGSPTLGLQILFLIMWRSSRLRQLRNQSNILLCPNYQFSLSLSTRVVTPSRVPLESSYVSRMPKIDWNPERIREAMAKRFEKRAYWYQIKTAEGLYAKKDVVGKAPTGAGKTLSFFGGLVMAMEEEPDGEKMVIIVSPLNLLSQQNVFQWSGTLNSE